MKEAGIQLRPISTLLTDAAGQPARYWIPAYQRGYRWTPLQVTQLLDDIWEFIQHCERIDEPPEAFYRLQPLVIKERPGGEYEVVDGQQRLTTLYILLTYLGDMLGELGKVRYQIHFETRGEANEPFLGDIDLDRADENVDFFHICNARKAIDKWFAERDKMHRRKLLQHVLNDDDIGHNVKVTWFELEDQDDPVAAFTRLNVGKIPLTNDELIRALFLRRAAAKDKDEEHGLALRIAHEWDQMEKALQDDSFWYFLSNEQAPGHNRIGLIFELVASDGLNDLLKQDAYGVFHVFNERREDQEVEQEWLAVKQTFMALEEWYEDRELFHVVGFLIHQGEVINDLLKSTQECRKGGLARDLRRRAFAKSIGGKLDDLDPQELRETIQKRCETISYGSESGAIRTILLLFNLATLLDNPRSNMRFQFDSFKSKAWDIEHVRSVEVRSPARHNERKVWLSHCRDYIYSCRGYINSSEDDEKLLTDIDGFLELTDGDEAEAAFDPLYERVLEYFKENGEGGEDGLANLTLLDESTNRSYKNSVFAVKRQRLLELDKSGIFVPLCTRNVFLKCYSTQVDNILFWRKQDAEAYLEEIIDTLTRFFLQKGGFRHERTGRATDFQRAACAAWPYPGATDSA